MKKRETKAAPAKKAPAKKPKAKSPAVKKAAAKKSPAKARAPKATATKPKAKAKPKATKATATKAKSTKPKSTKPKGGTTKTPGTTARLVPFKTAAPILKKGSKGDAVKTVQQQLNDAGYGPITVDGDFGAKTDSAVRRFQADRGFIVDGLVGPVTAASLATAATLGPVIVTDMAVLDDDLRAEYNRLWSTCAVAPEHQAEVDKVADSLFKAKSRYDSVARKTGVPWHVIAAIHSLESGQDFTTHLHNGDPLTAKTVHVPAGRPPGNPPFTWEDSAVDALNYDHFVGWTDWSVAGTLFKIEKYNGSGYRKQKPPATSAYLWSYTNQHLKGKYVADHVYDPNAVPKHPGAAAIFKSMGAKKYATLGAQKPQSSPLAGPQLLPGPAIPLIKNEAEGANTGKALPAEARFWPKAID